jgi:hypothetical protein
MMSEPDVTLTDYGLAIECAVLALLLLRQGNFHGPLRIWFALFFASVGLAALAGGTVHGFFPGEETLGHAILWPTVLIAIGFTALAGWAIGARLLFAPRPACLIWVIAAIGFVGYCMVVVFISRTFTVAVMTYVPALLFLATAFTAVYARSRAPELLFGVGGLVLTLVAAGLQQLKIGLHPVYFNHNALYHLIQALALLMIFKGARWIVVAR